MNKFTGLEIKRVGFDFEKQQKNKKSILKKCFLFLILLLSCIFFVLCLKTSKNINFISQNNAFSNFGSEIFRKRVFEVFAPTSKSNLSKLKINAPIIYKNFENIGGTVTFFVDKVELANCAINGKIAKIETNSLSKKIKIEIGKNQFLVFSGISICGVKTGDIVNSGTILGSVNNLLTVELFADNKKQSLMFLDGFLVWVN